MCLRGAPDPQHAYLYIVAIPKGENKGKGWRCRQPEVTGITIGLSSAPQTGIKGLQLPQVL
jgi:hypothetical protein